uniref:RecA family profile 1 domain-containing protein n=1 Tax=Haptolina ericina TaxID=156174 RepID=A0A6T9EBD6_9EUKA|mmetsp:Transcript_31083/g.70226  ORF Transcript_31083/g.70226 Transcript_31083/m.70226 type:complete len:245 (+) Transcript_31083:145-879(+)
MRVQGRKGVPNIERYICDVAVARHKVGTSSEDELWVLKHRALKVALPLSPTLSHCEAVFDAHLHEIRFLSTGFSSVDELLGGGLVAGEVTEIIGPVGAGKSQLCLAICAHQVATQDDRVLFVDTCGCFCTERVNMLILSCAPGLQRHERRARLGQQLQVRRASNLRSLLAVLQSVKQELESAVCSARLRALAFACKSFKDTFPACYPHAWGNLAFAHRCESVGFPAAIRGSAPRGVNVDSRVPC